jgi:mannosyltransferase
MTTPQPVKSRRALWTAALVLVLLLAAGLRLHRLGAQSLWNDEGATVQMTLRSAGDILTNAAADIHPPGYYLLLAGWTQIAGRSELALRAVSALAGVLTVAFAYGLGKRLLGRDAGLAAALLLALNTFAIYYAQEARMYALLGLWATAGMWALVVWLQSRENTASHPRRWPLIALALINVAGLYTQYAYPLTMIAQGVVMLVWLITHRDRRALGLYIAANLATLLIFAPWAGEAIRQVTTWPNSGGAADPAGILSTLTLGLTTGGRVDWLPAFAALALAAMGLWANRARILLLLPAIWAAVTVGAFLLLGLQPDDIKQLTPAASAIAIWLGIGAAALWRDKCLAPQVVFAGAAVILLVTLGGGLSPLYTHPDYQRDDYRAIAARIQADPRADDAVILNGPGQGEVWAYYYTGDAPVYPLPAALGGDDAATQAAMDAILRDHRRIFTVFWGENERDPNHVVENALDRSAFEVDTTWYGDVRLVTYAAPGDSPDAPTDTLDLPFGDHIMLTGFALNRAQFAPGDALMLSLFWTTDAPLAARYKVFVHLYADPDAPPPAQHDSEPAGGQAPTIDWQPGAAIIDRHGIVIPPDLPPGEYTLAVGIYDSADPAARLESPLGERAALATINID